MIQAVSLADVRREINFCQKVNLPILGMVENMSGFVCPHCAECSNLFSAGGGENLAKSLSIPFLGRIPIDPLLTTAIENSNFPSVFQESSLYEIFCAIANRLVDH